MSDDHSTPSSRHAQVAADQIAEWRARAERNRADSERKRRRSLESDGGTSVSELLAKTGYSPQAGRLTRGSGRAGAGANGSGADGAVPPAPPAPSSRVSWHEENGRPGRHGSGDTGYDGSGYDGSGYDDPGYGGLARRGVGPGEEGAGQGGRHGASNGHGAPNGHGSVGGGPAHNGTAHNGTGRDGFDRNGSGFFEHGERNGAPSGGGPGHGHPSGYASNGHPSNGHPGSGRPSNGHNNGHANGHPSSYSEARGDQPPNGSADSGGRGGFSRDEAYAAASRIDRTAARAARIDPADVDAPTRMSDSRPPAENPIAPPSRAQEPPRPPAPDPRSNRSVPPAPGAAPEASPDPQPRAPRRAADAPPRPRADAAPQSGGAPRSGAAPQPGAAPEPGASPRSRAVPPPAPGAPPAPPNPPAAPNRPGRRPRPEPEAWEPPAGSPEPGPPRRPGQGAMPPAPGPRPPEAPPAPPGQRKPQNSGPNPRPVPGPPAVPPGAEPPGVQPPAPGRRPQGTNGRRQPPPGRPRAHSAPADAAPRPAASHGVEPHEPVRRPRPHSRESDPDEPTVLGAVSAVLGGSAASSGGPDQPAPPPGPQSAPQSESDPQPEREPAPEREPGPEPAAPEPAEEAEPAPVPPRPRRPLSPRPRTDEDRLTMTDQMEPVDEQTQYKRKIDNTLARFSAAHDELEAEEEERRARKAKLAARLDQTRTKLQAVVTSTIGGRGSAVGNSNTNSNTNDNEDPDAHDAGDDVAAHAEAGADDAGESGKTSERTRLQEKKQRKNDRARLATRIAAVALAALVFLATGIAWGAKTWFESKFNQIAALDEGSSDILPGQIGDENFIILGSDTREGADTEENVGDADAVGGARSDTLMVAHIPEDRARAVVVSFPRDLEITRPECESWDPETGEYGDVVPAQEATKINTAYAVGGPKCVTKVVQDITGMKINHFVGVDFHGFKDMVDAVDGVPVQIDEPVVDETLGDVVTETGLVELRGDQALSYVRARKVYSDPTFSDYGRMERQQKFLSALLTKTLSSEVLFDTDKLTGFVDAFAKATFGENIGVDQMLTLAQSMRGFDAGAVQFLTIPTVGESNERGNEVVLEEDSRALFDAIIDNTPLPGEEGADGNGNGEGNGSGQDEQGEPGEQRAVDQPADTAVS